MPTSREIPYAHPLVVPFDADSVLSPEIRTGEHNAIRFPCESREDPGPHAIVRFEGLDAIRECRGEIRPYEIAEEHRDFLDRWNPAASIQDGLVIAKKGWSRPTERYPWVWEVEHSHWLAERHAYEDRHYRHPLIPDFTHYLFVFHDEFVEAIARGIWFHSADEGWDEPPYACPFGELPGTSSVSRGSEAGIEFEIRRNPAPVSELLERSAFCSQTVLQFNIVLDGRNSCDWRLYVRRFRDGRVLAQFGNDLFVRKNMLRFNHVPSESQLVELWLERVRDLAAYRRMRS